MDNKIVPGRTYSLSIEPNGYIYFGVCFIQKVKNLKIDERKLSFETDDGVYIFKPSEISKSCWVCESKLPLPMETIFTNWIQNKTKLAIFTTNTQAVIKPVESSRDDTILLQIIENHHTFKDSVFCVEIGTRSAYLKFEDFVLTDFTYTCSAP